MLRYSCKHIFQVFYSCFVWNLLPVSFCNWALKTQEFLFEYASGKIAGFRTELAQTLWEKRDRLISAMFYDKKQKPGSVIIVSPNGNHYFIFGPCCHFMKQITSSKNWQQIIRYYKKHVETWPRLIFYIQIIQILSAVNWSDGDAE